MGYTNMQDAPATPQQSLVSDTGRAADRLSEILGRIITIGDALHGPEPREAAGGGEKISPVPILRRNLDRAFDLFNSIENELNRIESRL